MILLLSGTCLTAGKAPEITGENPRSANEGHLTLDWTGPEKGLFRVEQSRKSDFDSPLQRYEGPDRAFFTSGLPEGAHYFRVGVVESDQVRAWSVPLKVTVHYPVRNQVTGLLLLGGLVFLALVGVIVGGHLRYYRKAGPRDE